MKDKIFHRFKVLIISALLLSANICNGQDCPNWGAASLIDCNFEILVSQSSSSVDYKGVTFSFSLTETEIPSGFSCDNGEKCKNYVIGLSITNNNSHKIFVKAVSFEFRPDDNLEHFTEQAGWEYQYHLESGEVKSNLFMDCLHCGWKAGAEGWCWCDQKPSLVIFRVCVDDLKESSFENWRSSGDSYYTWAHDKDTEPIEYRICAKQHYLKALEYKEDSYCREKIAEIDAFLAKINSPDNSSVDEYNKRVDEYNEKEHQINDYIEAGNYEEAIKLLEELKILAEKIDPDLVAALEEKINELKEYLLNQAEAEAEKEYCTEGDNLINNLETALNGYITVIGNSMNYATGSSDQLISSAQSVNDIALQLSNLGCTLSPEQQERLDEMMRKFADQAMKISDEGLNNLINSTNVPLDNNVNNGNWFPGATQYTPQEKTNNSTLKSTYGGGATLKGEAYDGKQY